MTPLEHFIERLRTARAELDPFPHYCLDEVFPDDYYQSLLQHLPASDVYENLYEVTDLKLDHFRHRDQRDMNDGWTNTLPPALKPFWLSFNKWFMSPELAQAVLASFNSQRTSWPEVSVESQFIRHRPGYFLGPHSDLYTKLVVLLIYLAPDNSAEHLGTSLYRPKDPSFTCPDSKHYNFEDFIRVKTAPYRPNSLLAFMRSDISFHGLEPLSIAGRDVIQYVLHDKQVREAQLRAKREA
ncbi:MAG TPA: hypothetical protein VHS05_03985 [Pyrinomonadaceae bacterium]|jgi:hypothetical protein|nr:hypothetical protein [Pyrinomonadaceae bacterium]